MYIKQLFRCFTVLSIVLHILPTHSQEIQEADDSGTWGPWSHWSACLSTSCYPELTSRSRSKKCSNRIASGNALNSTRSVQNCKGTQKQYRLCSVKECKGLIKDNRKLECDKQLHVPFRGRRYHWEPHLYPNKKCTVSCRSTRYGFHTDFGRLQKDGTSCSNSNEHESVCLHGKCQATMDRKSIRAISYNLPALVQPVPDITCYYGLICMTLELIRPPPNPMLNKRHRLLGIIEDAYSGGNVFSFLCSHRYQFFQVTGETPETFLDLLKSLRISSYKTLQLSPRNRVLLVLMWLRTYSTCMMLSSLFAISVSSVRVDIRLLIPIFYLRLKKFVVWPENREWVSMRGTWNKIPDVVGAIDGTSHEINRPMNEPQEQFYSRHRHHHAIHAQIIVDCHGTIRFVRSGFLGHQNDAQQYHMLPEIGADLSFPDQCVLLADKIYPNHYPVMTPYTNAQICRKQGRHRRKSLKLNRLIVKYCVCVEHAIADIKCYRAISSVWRHK